MLRSKYIYIRPQSEVYQLLEVTEATVRGHLSACIAAAQYDLYRYGKEEITPVTYQAGGGTYGYNYEMSPLFDYKVDVNSVNLYAEDLEAYYALNTLSDSVDGTLSEIQVSADNNEYAYQLDEHDYLTVRVASKGLKALGKPHLLAAYTGDSKEKLLPELKGYSVQVGDVVRVAVSTKDYKEEYDGASFPYVSVEGFNYPTSTVLLPESHVVVETSIKTETHAGIECVEVGSDTTVAGLYGLTGSKWSVSYDTAAALPAGLPDKATAAVVGANLEIEFKDSVDATKTVKVSIPTANIDFDVNLQKGTVIKLKFKKHEAVSKWLQREVVGLVGVTVPAKVENPGVQSVKLSDNPSAIYPDGSFTIADADKSAYRGRKDTNYVVTCTEVQQGQGFLGSKWTVTDTDDVDTYSYFVEMPASGTGLATVNIGRYGVKLTIDLDKVGASTLTSVGDQIIIPCFAEAESTTEFDGVKLSAAPGDINTILQQEIEDTYTVDTESVTDTYQRGITAIAFGKKVTGNIAREDDIDAAWTADEKGVTVLPGMALLFADRSEDPYVPFADGIGKLYTEMRVQVSPVDPDEDIFMIKGDEEIEDNFGTIDPDNDLAYACSRALVGAAGREIYALRVRGVDVDAFAEAYKKTETDTALYSFVPVTKDFAVMEHFVQKGLELSAGDVKRWRRTILGVDFPGAYIVAKDDFDDKILKCNLLYYNGGYTLVQLSKSVNFSFKDMVFDGGSVKLNPGDLIQFGAGSKYTVKAVLSDRELLLAEDYKTSLQQVPFRLWKADTTANNVEYVTGVARRFNTRRAVTVWCDRGTTMTDDDTVVIDNKYLAAEIAGISSAVVPQQGITHTEITTINKATRMYTQYTQNQLDSIASQGVLIVTQDTKNTPCYIRHQLTTEMDKGNLYWEDSCTRNIDNISYAIVDTVDPFIGKANVTPRALRRLRYEVSETLNKFLVDVPSENGDLVGPSLVAWDNLYLAQDSVYMDRINIRVRVHLPLPLNNVRVEEIGIIAKVTI